MITQADDACLNQHHELECSEFNIIEANSLDLDNDQQHTKTISYISLHEKSSKISNSAEQTDAESTSNNDEDEGPTTACNEAKIMFKLAIPVSITSIARIAMWNTDQIFLGHLGTKQLAGASLADTCMEILTMFVYTPAWSLNGLCSQALGSGNSVMVGYWLQLTIIICTIICIPVSIGYFYVSDLIHAFSDDPEVVEYSKQFAHYALLFLWTNAMMATIRLFHQSLEVVTPFTIISMIAIALNVLGNQLWLYGLHVNVFGEWTVHLKGLGFIGSPLATSTSMCVQLAMYYVWCFQIKKYHLVHETWNGWSLKQTILNKQRVKEYVKVVVPLIISNASENWGYQVIILYAATLDAAEIAAMSCTFAVWGILWSFYSGFGSAVVTRLGKKIGSGNVDDAKLVSKVGCVLSASTCILTALMIFFLSNEIAMIYSKDAEVIALMHQTIRLLCVLYVAGGFGWSAMNVLEAMSKNKAKGIINVLTAWLGYVPGCVYFMSGDNHKLLGVSPVSCIFFVGIIVEVLRALALWSVVFCVDWEEACIEAQKRNDKYDELAKENEDKDVDYMCLQSEKDEDKVEEVEKNSKEEDGNVLKCGLLESAHDFDEAATAV